MTVNELRAILSRLPPDMEIVTFMAATETVQPVTLARVIDETDQWARTELRGSLLIDTAE